MSDVQSVSTTGGWQRIKGLIRSQTLVYFASAALGRVAGLVLIPMYTRQLTRDEFATLSLSNTLQSLLPIGLSLGLVSATSKVYFDTPMGADPLARAGVVARGAVMLSVALATVVALSIFTFFPSAGLSGFSVYRLLLVTGAGLGVALTMIPDTIYRARKQAVSAAFLNLATFGLTVSISLFLVQYLHRGLDGVLEATCLASMTTGTWGAVFSWFVLRNRSGQQPDVSLRSTLRFSLPFVPHFLANWAFGAGDRWTLSAVGRESLLGLYAVGVQLSTPVPMFTQALNDVQAAAMGATFREKGLPSLRQVLKRDMLRSIGLSAIPYGALLLSWPLLGLVLGPRFHQGLFLVPFVGLAGILEGAYYPPVNVLFYAGQTRLIPLITTVSAIIAIALCAGLSWAFGMPGLVGARILSSATRTGLCWLAARKSLPNEPVTA